MPEKPFSDFSEIEIYFVLNTTGYMRWRLNHDAADGRTPDTLDVDKEIERLYNVQVEAAAQLSRFGITPCEPDGKTPSKEYWNWWYKWDSYAKGLSKKEYEKLEARINNGEDTSDIKIS